MGPIALLRMTKPVFIVTLEEIEVRRAAIEWLLERSAAVALGLVTTWRRDLYRAIDSRPHRRHCSAGKGLPCSFMARVFPKHRSRGNLRTTGPISWPATLGSISPQDAERLPLTFVSARATALPKRPLLVRDAAQRSYERPSIHRFGF
jgi:hypothetical protein